MKKHLFIFDWDDTLFPSSSLKYNLFNTTINNRNALVYLDHIIYYVLNYISSFGTIIIITNASKQWVNMSLKYLPKSSTIISRLTIISAHDLYINRDNLTAQLKPIYWKLILYNKLVPFFNNYLSVVNIGDSLYEMNAMKSLRYNNLFKKDIYVVQYKLQEEPNIIDMIKQFASLYKNIKLLYKNG